jgi:hypothetical protein
MVEDYRRGHSMNLVMDSDTGQAIAYMVKDFVKN